VSQAQAINLLKEGIAAARAGNKTLTRRLLTGVTDLEPGNEIAWLWLAGVAESPRTAVQCLERVLEINPANERARAALRPALLQAGIDAAKGKDKPRARDLLGRLTREDPGNEAAWLGLAGVTDTPQEAVTYLEMVLHINPQNERAQSGLTYYRSRMAPLTPVWECPLCQAKDQAKQTTCPACKAVLTLASLEAVCNNPAVDGARVKAALDRLGRLRQEAEKPEFTVLFHLGLAHLNLGQLGEGIGLLQLALQAKPTDRALRNQITALGQRKAAAEAAERERAEQERLARQRSIMIVDDSPTIRKLVTLTMEGNGHRVTAAADGYEAVDKIRERGVPDLILLDITMPGMDGYQLCKLLRQNRDTAHVPVILLSGKDGFFSKVRGKLAGSTEYITKPFKPEALLRVVDKYCTRAKAASGR
jgi:twitching motility two-component system response regulator PilG